MGKNNVGGSDYRSGVLGILLCQLLWGALPIYWKSLVPIDSWMIIIYRIVLVFLVSLLIARKSYTFGEIFKPLRENPKQQLVFIVAGLIITINWSVYIWAVNAGYIVQCSIGYYIEPLMVCLFGIVLFREKLTRYKSAAMGMACISVLIILIHYRQLPGVALMLAITFSIYSAIKKKVDVPPTLSLVYETMYLAPIALIAIIYLESTGKGALSQGEPYQYGLLLLCGFATAIPLALFSMAAQKLTLFMVGLLSYLSPSIQLILGVLVYHEPFDRIQFLAFLVIWIGLVIFTYGEYVDSRKEAR